MQEWAQMFANNPDFGIMEQAYMKLKTQSKPTEHQSWP
jgi:signal transducing adaptor molecule